MSNIQLHEIQLSSTRTKDATATASKLSAWAIYGNTWVYAYAAAGQVTSESIYQPNCRTIWNNLLHQNTFGEQYVIIDSIYISLYIHHFCLMIFFAIPLASFRTKH